MRTLFLLVLSALLSCGEPAEPADSLPPLDPLVALDPLFFVPAANMANARMSFSAVLLDDGRVWVVGGEDADRNMLDTTELYDPATDGWSPGPRLPEPRANLTTTLLADGRVLVVGGGRNNVIGVAEGRELVASALLFDPATGELTTTGALSAGRSHQFATRLGDGRVAIVGGAGETVGEECTPACIYLGSAPVGTELYDPATGEFSPGPALATGRFNMAAVQLPDQRIMVVGGANPEVYSLATVELVDMVAGRVEPMAGLTTDDRLHHAAAMLGSGRVLVAGGKKANVRPLKSTERYDLASGAWAEVGELPEPATAATMTTLRSGSVLFVGGFNQYEMAMSDFTGVFDRAGGQWRPLRVLGTARALHTSVLLADGRVLICGGMANSGAVLRTCEVAQNRP